MEKRIESVAVACHDMTGVAWMPVYAVEVTEEEFKNGVHKDKAKKMALQDKFVGPWVFFADQSLSEISRAANSI